MILKDYPFKVIGLKLVKSDPIIVNDEIIWDGINKDILLGQFKEGGVARNFSRNIKNNTSKKHWRITLTNEEIHLNEEMGYTEKEDYSYRKQRHFYDRR